MPLMTQYILDKSGQAVAEPDHVRWGEWMQTHDRTIASDRVGDTRVSTVFIGINRSIDGSAPKLFETMVFGGPLEYQCDRYATLEDALKGHEAMLERVKNHASE